MEKIILCECGKPIGNGQINAKPVCDQCFRASQTREWMRITQQQRETT